MDRTKFYNDVTKKFLTRYGYDLAFKENIAGNIDDWEPEDRKKGLSAAHGNNWFRHRFNGKRLHSSALGSILKRMQMMSGSAAHPQRKLNITVYSSKYYALKLKDGFDNVWARVKDTVPAKERISMCQDYVRSHWEEESDEVKEEVAREADTHVPEESAEEYHNALETFDEVRIPLADALAERLGMHVVILAVGPVGSQRGEVRLRSVFSDTSSGQTSKVWGEFDRAGFTAAEVSLTRYGRAFFIAWPLLDPPLDPPLDPAGPTAMTTMRAVVPAVPPPPPPPPAVNAGTSSAPTAAIVPVPPADAPDQLPAAATLDPMERYQYRWTETQVDVHDLMITKQWGPRWKDLIEVMVQFEGSLLWHDDSLPRSAMRPEEIRTWMKEHRKPDDNYKILPKFRERMLAWWRDIGLTFRQEPQPETLAEDEEWPPKTVSAETLKR
ncbi:hypothetical protein B0H14DRAFT_3478733 [Mycena olivaceomarginata]|nr:hypothetical protein B0H14DRAFT_3478733 [Mycena olivaceomarginata]